ncbi:MAG: carbon-nitrogen hydrolase family protein [Planctomycetes bacterium]|nr:carbon-nitrogen hydrolase family protein [Planctomycetota bacterium]
MMSERSLPCAAALACVALARALAGPALAPCVAELSSGERREGTPVATASDTQRVSFGDAGEALLRVTRIPEGAVYEVISSPPAVRALEFVRVPAAKDARIGSILNIAWQGDEAICVIAGTLATQCRPLRAGADTLLVARASSRFGIRGAKAALVAGPASEIRLRIDAAAARMGLPRNDRDGIPAKDLEDARRSYLFLMSVAESDVDRAVAWARAGGFGAVMLSQTSWSRTTGHYLFDERRFPGGIDGLAAVVSRLHDAGLRAGLHIWVSKISKNDPYATPVPDRRIWKDRRARLAEGIDGKTDAIRAAEPIGDWPGGSVARRYEGREELHCDLIIDDEIIRYEKAGAGAGADVFSGCRRGAYGTRAAPHAAGAEILHPGIDGCIPGYIIDQDTDLLDEVASRAAAIYDRCGFDMIYFDGGEDVPGDYWYHSAKFQLAALERIRRRPVIHQGTILTHFIWHTFARTNTVDIRKTDVKAHIDRSVAGLERCRANLIPGELGWFGLWPPSGSNPGLQLDEIEYLLAKSLAFDAPISIETSPGNLAAHPLTGQILEMIRTYEDLRMRRAAGDETRRMLEERGAEFALLSAAGEPRFIPVEPPIRIRAASGGAEARASLGPLDGGSVAILWTMEKRAELRIPVARETLSAATFSGEGVPIAGGASEAVISLGPARLTVRATALPPEGLREALARAAIAKPAPRVLWVPAPRTRRTSGAIATGDVLGIADAGALSRFLVFSGGSTAGPGADAFAEYEVAIPEAGRWYIWARVRYGGAVDHSFWLVPAREGAKPEVLGNCGRNDGAWHWTGRGSGIATEPPGVPIALDLPAGPFRFRISPREGAGRPASDPRLDALCLSDDPAFRPDDAAARAALGTAAPLESAPRGADPRDPVRLSVISLAWSPEGRALEAVLGRIDEAARDGPDLILLPQECVATAGEPIPGPIADAIAEKARKYHTYIVGNIREKDEGKTFVTSFLIDRDGRIAGTYRKSHRFPDEDLDLGDALPVFPTDIGRVAMRIGTDRFFPEIDMVYAARGARIILWSQAPEPIEDEHIQDFPSRGRAVDLRVAIACARYGPPAGAGWITNFYPPYCGSPIGRSYVIDRQGQRIACTRRSGGVATATFRRADLAQAGRPPDRRKGFGAIAAKAEPVPARAPSKRRVRVTAIEAHVGIDDLVAKLDRAGRLGSDIACTYEFVWIHGGDAAAIARMTDAARKNLERIRAKAREHRMYVLVAGVVDRIERNEAILYDRSGEEAGRFFKIAKTHDEQVPGEEAPVFETDFGRIGVRICADEWFLELDRSYAIKGADIVFTPTQSWGPDAMFRDLRDISRAMDGGYFLVECTHPSTEARHRTKIIDPAGTVIAASAYRRPGIVSAEIDLDADRPARALRIYDPHQPRGYLPQFQPERMPRVANDLREAILAARRPDLYGDLSPR